MTFVTGFRIFNTRKAIFCAVIIYLLPFFIFSWWNHPTSDDFIIGVKRHEAGFWALQKFYYTQWSGRYFASIISSILSYSGLLYSHYYLYAAMFLLITIAAWQFTFLQINRYLLKTTYPKSTLILFSYLCWYCN